VADRNVNDCHMVDACHEERGKRKDSDVIAGLGCWCSQHREHGRERV